MIAYEIQLRCVIRDKIQSETTSSPRQFFSQKKFVGKKNLSQILSQTDSNQSELSRTNQYLSSLSGTYRNEVKSLRGMKPNELPPDREQTKRFQASLGFQSMTLIVNLTCVSL